MTGLEVKHANGRTVLGVKVVPGSSRTSAAGFWNGMLKVKVAAPPEKGKANKALVEFIADALGLRSKDVVVVSGETSPVKHIEIAAHIEADVLEKLGGA